MVKSLDKILSEMEAAAEDPKIASFLQALRAWKASREASGEAFARMPVFGGTNVHLEKPVPEGVTYLHDFMCSCGPRRFEDTEYEATFDRDRQSWVKGTEAFAPSDGQRRCEEVRTEVHRRLDADDSNMLTRAIFTLNWDYAAHITAIENDQWSGIAAETYSVADPSADRPRVKVYVECDDLEDGIARVWKFFADEIPLRGEGSFTFSDADVGDETR